MQTKNFLSVILICALLGACSSVKTLVLDESVPPEQRSRLNIGYDPLIGSADSSAVIVYDNKPVAWNGPNYAVYIPSGEHSFLVKYSGRSSGGETVGMVAGGVGGFFLEVVTFGLFQGALIEEGGKAGAAIGSGIDDAVAAARSRAASEAALKAAEEAAGGTGSPIIIVIGLPSGYLTANIPNTEFTPGGTYRLREPSLLRRDWINKTAF